MMTRMGLPVPPGFVVTVGAHQDLMSGTHEIDITNHILNAIDDLNTATSLTYGKDMLVSVRSGAEVSMPGMMDTILNCGITSDSLPWLVETYDEEVAYRLYIDFLAQFGKVVYKSSAWVFQNPYTWFRGKFYSPINFIFTSEKYLELIENLRVELIDSYVGALLDNPKWLVIQCVKAVWESWFSSRASAYRKNFNINSKAGTAVNIVKMVYGTLDNQSGTGVVFSRNPAIGGKELYGEYMSRAQGEALVGGAKTPSPIEKMKEFLPKQYSQLEEIAAQLEIADRNVQDIEFTVESGTLYILQQRAAKQTSQAKLINTVALVDEEIITIEEAVDKIDRTALEQYKHPTIDPEVRKSLTPFISGLAASPGVVTAPASMSVKHALAHPGSILIVRQTEPEHVPAMIICAGMLTFNGGITCHAAVVSRELNIPAVVGCEDVWEADDMVINGSSGKAIYEGEMVTLDGTMGVVYAGAVDEIIVDYTDSDIYRKVRGWLDDNTHISDKVFTIGIINRLTSDFAEQEFVEPDDDAKWWPEIIMNLNLDQIAVDFYLLSNWVVGRPDMRPVLTRYSEVVSSQLAIYLDAACGGEARHKSGGFYSMNTLMARGLARQDWRALRIEHGVNILQELTSAFNDGYWKSQFGGTAWAKASELLTRFLTGEITPIIFVDLAFDLEHNSGTIFNKIAGEGHRDGWQMMRLKSILDQKFHGNLEKFEEYASSGVKELVSYAQDICESQVTVDGYEAVMANLETESREISGGFRVGDHIKVRMSSRAKKLRGREGTIKHVNTAPISLWVDFGFKCVYIRPSGLDVIEHSDGEIRKYIRGVR